MDEALMGIPNLMFAGINTVYYHEGCNDGMAGAWAAWSNEHARRDCKYIPYSFGHKPNATDYIDRNVVFIDSCPPRDALLEMKKLAKNVWVLDHHKTGREECQDIDGTYFNYNMSGASIAWRAFHGSKKKPLLISYAEDIDLWKFNLPMSRAVQTALYNVPFTFDDFDALAVNSVFKELITSGIQLTEYRDNILDTIARNAQRSVCVVDSQTYEFVAVNISYFHSAMGDKLRHDADFAVMWYMKADGTIKFGLRSARSFGADVSVIAAALNPHGGGHANSAGAIVTVETAMKFLNGDFDDGD